MITVPNKATEGPSLAAALAMYQRLRKTGQTPTLARLSVEGRYTQFTREQRERLHKLLAEIEV